MDNQHFRTPTTPNYTKLSQQPYKGYSETQGLSSQNDLNPRYPGFAPISSDANIFTDYKPKCSKNIPSDKQYVSKLWLQHNAETIMKLSRERQAKLVGANFSHSVTIPPPAAIVKCNPKECSYELTNPFLFGSDKIPTGIERMDKAPELFGTFSFLVKNTTQTPQQIQSRKSEGGRNSIRG